MLELNHPQDLDRIPVNNQRGQQHSTCSLVALEEAEVLHPAQIDSVNANSEPIAKS